MSSRQTTVLGVKLALGDSTDAISLKPFVTADLMDGMDRTDGTEMDVISRTQALAKFRVNNVLAKSHYS